MAQFPQLVRRGNVAAAPYRRRRSALARLRTNPPNSSLQRANGLENHGRRRLSGVRARLRLRLQARSRRCRGVVHAFGNLLRGARPLRLEEAGVLCRTVGRKLLRQALSHARQRAGAPDLVSAAGRRRHGLGRRHGRSGRLATLARGDTASHQRSIAAAVAIDSRFRVEPHGEEHSGRPWSRRP
jgi:hypothetical protein